MNRRDIKKTITMVIVLAVVIVGVIYLINEIVDPVPSLNRKLETNSSVPVAQEETNVVVESVNDGSVIVRDKGASFNTMQSSRNQPKPVMSPEKTNKAGLK
jgi:hypothetical protein